MSTQTKSEGREGKRQKRGKHKEIERGETNGHAGDEGGKDKTTR